MCKGSGADPCLPVDSQKLSVAASYTANPRDLRRSPYQTCHRYYQLWMRRRVLFKVLAKRARDLEERGAYDLSECFVDATFVPARKGPTPTSGLPSAAKTPRSW